MAAFCRERGVCAPQFFAWKKRLRQAETAQQPQGGIGGEAAKFVEVKVTRAAPEPDVPGGATVEVRLQQRAEPAGGAGIRRRACAGVAGGGGERGVIGLPSLHALDRAQAARIWLAAEATDMRCGFDRLAERVKAVIGEDPLSGHLFVFRSRRGDRLKILVWERDGFVLWYKRLEAGRVQAAAGGGRIAARWSCGPASWR